MYCGQCGTPIAENSAFCASCGAPVPLARPLYEQPMYQQRRSVPGRGLGITSLVFGILSMLLVVGALFIAVVIAEIAYYSGIPVDMQGLEDLTGFLGYLAAYGVLAVVFGVVSRCRGYKNGISTSGVVMGVVNIVFFVALIAYLLMR